MKPNIVYLHSHDTGRYIGPYGHAIETPNLQAFAEEGVLFRKAFTVNPTCSPSRAALLTGTWPHCNGMTGLAHRGSNLNDYSEHLVHTLNVAGYETALTGFQHVARDTDVIGYSRRAEKDDPGTDEKGDFATARRAVNFIRESHDKPFFLDCGFHTTHRTSHSKLSVEWHNHDDSPLGDARYCNPPAPLPDTPEVRADFADYKVAATRLDTLMGDVIRAIDEAGLADNTLIICTTDHGIAFPHMKCNLSDHGIGVMMMLRGQGFAGGQVVDPMVTHLDLFPTICDVAGIEAPSRLQGNSLVPLVNGDVELLHDAIFAEVNYHASYEPKRAVRTERYKYIKRIDPLDHPVLPNCDDSESKSALLAAGWGTVPQEEERLFDLLFDPNEACNLVADPNYAGVLSGMRDRLDRWMRDTDDPALAGRVEPWPEYVMNPVDGASPRERTVPAS